MVWIAAHLVLHLPDRCGLRALHAAGTLPAALRRLCQLGRLLQKVVV